jgi:hypothetical protein
MEKQQLVSLSFQARHHEQQVGASNYIGTCPNKMMYCYHLNPEGGLNPGDHGVEFVDIF